MNNDKKLFEELLKTDGIDPKEPTESERENFRAMLDSEKKNLNALQWRATGLIVIFALVMVGMCLFSDRIESKLGISNVGTWLIAMSSCVVMFIIFAPGYYRKTYESGKKVHRLNYLVHGKHRGLILIGKKDGKRHIYWLRIVLIYAGLWLLMSLGGAAVYYLICQRWIYASGDMLHIFYCNSFSLSFVISVLYRGLKTPLDELTEIKDKSKPTKRI